MDRFTLLDYPGGVEQLLRFIHILAGITWIGLLYYCNFVQGPFFNQTEPEVKATATRQLVPRALWWFRYSALVTFLVGVLLLLINLDQGASLATPYGYAVLTAGILGTLMFLNVWLVIWPKQKIVIASAEATATGGSADPRAADATRRAFLASRTNVVLSIPMLLFMVVSAHAVATSGGEQPLYWLIAGALIVLVELNALVGLTGGAKQPLEKVPSVIWSGVILAVIVYVLYATLGGDPGGAG